MQISLNKPLVVDHVEREFRIVIRSMNNVGADTLKNLIQTKFEVVKCEQVKDALTWRET